MRRKLVWSVLLAVSAGLLYGWCFPPRHWWPLAWIALAPVLVIVRESSTRRAAWLAALFAVAGTCATVDWLPKTVMTYFGQSAAAGIGLFLAVTFVMVVPPVVAFALAYKALAGRVSGLLPLWAGAAWTATELARANLWTGNPWVLLGYSQVGVDPVVQIADVTGVYGLSFLVALVNAALAECWLSARRSAKGKKVAAKCLATASVALAVALGYGSLRLAERQDREAGATSVAVVQGNIDLGARWRNELYGRNLDVYLRLTAEALHATGARLVVWPENAMTFYLAYEPLYQKAISLVLDVFGAQLLAGGPHHDANAKDPSFFNSAFVLSPAGEITARYDKERLLPFGEYFPLPRLEFLRRRFVRVREFSSGGPAAPVPTVAGAAGILICNEAMFPEVARSRVHAGSEILVNLTNDSWMNDRKFSEIAFDMSVLRAVEQRRYLIRASTSGPSAVIDPYGRVQGKTELFTQSWSEGGVVPQHRLTAYARLGDSFAFGCVLVVLGVLVQRWARPSRAHREG